MGLRESLDQPVSSYADTGYAEASAEETVSDAARSMQKAGRTEVIVIEGGVPIGIVTERDILYKVVAEGSDPARVKVADVMTSPVQTVDEGSKVAEAISQMSKLGLRRLGVTRKGKLVGLVSQKSVVSGPMHQSVGLPELANPDQLRCPYCDSVMKDRNELSKHIDQVHLGLGLLEGDTSKW